MALAADAEPGSGVAGLFAADEEVGRDLATVDWAATPLGLPGSWPQSLQTAVDILLSSRFSMWMAWGAQLTFFCNAAYRRHTLGRKYPWALVAALLRGESALVSLVSARFAVPPAGAWSEPPVQALVAPLAQQGGPPYGFLVAALNRYRPLDEGYRAFVGLVTGHLAAGIASARSYQDQQRRAEELAELDRAKTTFFSNISHEFRTPLTLIMGPVQELRRRLADADPQVREELEVISRNGLRLGKLVNMLLDFSRIEAGRMQASYEPADIAQVTAELASVFRSAVDRAGLAFKVDCPPLPEPVYLDRGMWEKVVLNLLSNALKFTFDGSIHIAVRAEGGQAVVTVADTGIGVPAREMPRLFERFHRIENTRSRSNEGSGIGLALVQELVQLHGGTITASSTVGAGTTFTIRLPFGHAHLAAGALVPAGHAATVSAGADPFVQEALRWLPGTAQDDGGTGARPVHEEITPANDTDPSAQAGRALPARVLVADDNADMREYLARLLRSAGYRVITVTDGQAALDAVRAGAPDLVISDVMMPRLDGLGLVAALRADARTAAVPVLLLSARAGQEASIEGLRAGADDYLVKPFSAAELLARARASVELVRFRNRESQFRRTLIDSLQEGFFLTDQESTILEANQAFTYCDSATIRALFIAARKARLTIQVSTAGSINETLLKVSGLNQIATVVTQD